MEVGQYAAMRDVPIKSSVKVDTHGGRPTSSYDGCTNLSRNGDSVIGTKPRFQKPQRNWQIKITTRMNPLL